jgi:Transposase DDE domain group 1
VIVEFIDAHRASTGRADLRAGAGRREHLLRAPHPATLGPIDHHHAHRGGACVLDLAMSLTIGGDCLADIAQLRAHPQVFGPVASDPTVSRLIDTLAAARRTAWSLAGKHAPDHGIDAARPLVIDVDAPLVTAPSDKERAAPTVNRGFGFHPLCVFLPPRTCRHRGAAGDPAAPRERRLQHRDGGRTRRTGTGR